MAQYIQGYKYITIHHTVTAPAATKEDLPRIARSIENYHKTKSYAQNYKTGGEFGYFYAQYHFLFAQDGSYIQLHDIKYQRVHATDSARGESSHNKHGIAIAIAGNMEETPPSAKLNEGISQLCASLEKKLGVNFTIRGHKETALYESPSGELYYPENTGVYYTQCPGSFMGTSKSGAIKEIIDRTNEILKGKPWYETVVRNDIKLTNPQIAYLYNIDTGEIVKTYLANSVIGVQYEMGDYYLTEYSVSNKIKNGFKKSEWKLYNVTEPEECKNEIDRLNQELHSLQNSYNEMSIVLEEKNATIDQLKTDLNTTRSLYENLETQMAEKKVIIDRLENDVKWCDEQIEEYKKKLEESSKTNIQNMKWSEILSGVLMKLFGKKPE